MPYAKVDVSFVREHLAAVPEKTRPAAIALYLELVVTSAEFLLDGVLPVQVVLAGAHEIGISRGRYGRSEVHKIGTSLAAAGLVEMSDDNTWLLPYWEEHHSSREEVEAQRNRATERKRKSRQQLTLESTGPMSHRDVTAESQRDRGRDTRAHARTRTATDSDERPVAAAINGDDPGAATANLDELLDQLEIHGSLRTAATHEPDRALAVACYTIANHAGGAYFRTVFESGDHPSTPEAAPEIDPADRRERYVRGDGHRLPDDELEYHLRQKGADDDEVMTLLELAADLRHAKHQTQHT